ncbi:MAG: uracil-DNA glycosylase [Candidatus Dojkabacteria bacterium]
MVKMEASWKNRLESEFEKPYFKELVSFVKNEYRNYTVYPPGPDIFKALNLCPFENVKVVILGQDPYHNPREANGLAFSVSDDVKVPPSLQNIYKEIEDDLGIKPPPTGNLERWVKQGVLLLNATLTVRAHQAGSHQKKGWEQFTDAIIKALNDERQNLVFLLWGKYAQEKGKVIDPEKHYILTSPHPSPFSAHTGFLGNKHFSKTNKFLILNGLEPIKW